MSKNGNNNSTCFIGCSFTHSSICSFLQWRCIEYLLPPRQKESRRLQIDHVRLNELCIQVNMLAAMETGICLLLCSGYKHRLWCQVLGFNLNHLLAVWPFCKWLCHSEPWFSHVWNREKKKKQHNPFTASAWRLRRSRAGGCFSAGPACVGNL